MKQHLYTKLLILYFVLGGICFLLLSSGGSYLVEKRLERSTGESLYRAASQMVSGNELRQSVKDPENASSPWLFPLLPHFKMQISGPWTRTEPF